MSRGQSRVLSYQLGLSLSVGQRHSYLQPTAPLALSPFAASALAAAISAERYAIKRSCCGKSSSAREFCETWRGLEVRLENSFNGTEVELEEK